MSKAPDWALEGATPLQAHRINRDWPEFQRKARAARSMEAANLVVGQVCDNLFEGRDPFAGMGEKS